MCEIFWKLCLLCNSLSMSLILLNEYSFMLFVKLHPTFHYWLVQ